MEDWESQMRNYKLTIAALVLIAIAAPWYIWHRFRQPDMIWAIGSNVTLTNGQSVPVVIYATSYDDYARWRYMPSKK